LHPAIARQRIGYMNARLIRTAALLLASAVLPSCAPVDALNASIATDGLRIDNNIRYQPGAMGLMDVYRPVNDAGKLPLVVFIYGGAWRSGSKDMYRFAAAPLARAGMVVAVPDYRKVPEVSFPGFLQDNASAVAYARAHATEWGADPDHIFLIGHSAGGYNALMLGLDPRYLSAVGLSPHDLAGVIGLAAPADFLPLDDPDTIAAFGSAPEPSLTQPVHFARSDAPPLLLLHGDQDDTVYPRNAVALSRRMNAVGGDVTYIRYPNLGHIGLVTALAPLFEGRAPVRDSIVRFIRQKSGG
jgi:acetyl esterase/lipase